MKSALFRFGSVLKDLGQFFPDKIRSLSKLWSFLPLLGPSLGLSGADLHGTLHSWSRSGVVTFRLDQNVSVFLSELFKASLQSLLE